MSDIVLIATVAVLVLVTAYAWYRDLIPGWLVGVIAGTLAAVGYVLRAMTPRRSPAPTPTGLVDAVTEAERAELRDIEVADAEAVERIESVTGRTQADAERLMRS